MRCDDLSLYPKGRVTGRERGGTLTLSKKRMRRQAIRSFDLPSSGTFREGTAHSRRERLRYPSPPGHQTKVPFSKNSLAAATMSNIGALASILRPGGAQVQIRSSQENGCDLCIVLITGWGDAKQRGSKFLSSQSLRVLRVPVAYAFAGDRWLFGSSLIETAENLFAV